MPTFNKENPAKTDVPTIIVNENSAIVYPNPVHDFLHISMTQERCQIVICDISGRILIEKMVDNQTQLDVTSLKKGMYLLKIHSNSFQYTTKIIKE